jgi:membrane-associated HD superfamily phosphohydrolase
VKRALDILRCALLLAAIALLCVTAWAVLSARNNAVKLAPKVSAALDSIQAMEKSTRDLEEATYAAEGEIANLADTTNGIATGLADHEEAQLKAAQDVSIHVYTLLNHADADVAELGNTERAATSAINGIAADSHATLGQTHQTLAAAAEQISNPAIADSLAKINQSAANTAAGTEQLAATAEDLRKIADHETAVILKPASKVKKALQYTAGLAGDFFHGLLF